MTYAQMKVDAQEMARRVEVITRINILGDKRNASSDKAEQKRIDKRIRQIARQETSWLKEAAFFLY